MWTLDCSLTSETESLADPGAHWMDLMLTGRQALGIFLSLGVQRPLCQACYLGFWGGPGSGFGACWYHLSLCIRKLRAGALGKSRILTKVIQTLQSQLRSESRAISSEEDSCKCAELLKNMLAGP